MGNVLYGSTSLKSPQDQVSKGSVVVLTLLTLSLSFIRHILRHEPVPQGPSTSPTLKQQTA